MLFIEHRTTILLLPPRRNAFVLIPVESRLFHMTWNLYHLYANPQYVVDVESCAPPITTLHRWDASLIQHKTTIPVASLDLSLMMSSFRDFAD